MDLRKRKAHGLATAHQAWDSLWGTEAGRKDWIAVERDVQDLEKELVNLKVSRVLDLGCGYRQTFALSRVKRLSGILDRRQQQGGRFHTTCSDARLDFPSMSGSRP